METNLILYFYSEGEKPSVIAEKIKSLGFDVAIGRYDFKYKWDKEPAREDILALADKLVDALKGCKAEFKLETK